METFSKWCSLVWCWRVQCCFVLACWPLSAHALIHGETFPSQAISTVKLNIQHAHYLQSVEQWEYYDSVCSAVVVGVKPLTVMTAAHCLREVRLIETNGLPEVSIAQAAQLGMPNAQIKQAFYRPYEAVSEDISLDIAVLVFDQANVPENIQPLEILLDEPLPEQLMICGYGRGYLEPETRQPRCAERAVIQSLSEFTDILPASYQVEDEMLHLKSRAQFEYTKELAHLDNVLLAVNRLNPQAEYDNRLPMPTVGDSGGPWLALGPRGQYQLVAMTSLVERFYNKSPHWKFFERDVPLSDYPYIAYGLRLSHPVIMAYLEYVKHSGADMTFSSNHQGYRVFSNTVRP